MKKIILLLTFIFIYGCGYTSVLKNQNQQDIKISIKNIEGDFQTNNFIVNQIKLSTIHYLQKILMLIFYQHMKR